MNSQKIKQLIEKYENGETSVAEEKALQSFFQQDEIPFNLRGYQAIFGYYHVASNEELPGADFDARLTALISEKKPVRSFNKLRSLYGISGIAASVIILIGLYFVMRVNNTYQDTYSDPAMAFAEVKKVLMKVSGNLNEGTKELQNVKVIEEGFDEFNKMAAFDDGLKTLQKISVLDKSQQLVTYKK